MRCPHCGTENAPDSRFCGGCGQSLSVSRLAPTAKISDDAPIAPPTRPATGPAPYVSYAPPAMPGSDGHGGPVAQAGVTTRPGGHSAPRPSAERPALRPSGPQPAAPSGSPRGAMYDSTAVTSERPLPKRATPEASNASLSFAAPQGRSSTGLIVFVLLVDLALAGAGAFLLAKGLATPDAKPAPTSNK